MIYVGILAAIFTNVSKRVISVFSKRCLKRIKKDQKEQKYGVENNFYLWRNKAYFSNHHTDIIISILVVKLKKVLGLVFVLLPNIMFLV